MYNFHILHVNTSTEEITFKSTAVNWASSDFHLPKMFGSLLKECESWIYLIMYICHAVQHTKNTVLGEDPQLHLLLGWNKNNVLSVTVLENTASRFTVWCLTTWPDICAGSFLLLLSFINRRHLIDPRQLVGIINTMLKLIFCLCLKAFKDMPLWKTLQTLTSVTKQKSDDQTHGFTITVAHKPQGKKHFTCFMFAHSTGSESVFQQRLFTCTSFKIYLEHNEEISCHQVNNRIYSPSIDSPFYL